MASSVVPAPEVSDEDPADIVEGLKQLSVARAQINSLRYVAVGRRHIGT